MQDYSQLERFGVHYCHPTPVGETGTNGASGAFDVFVHDRETGETERLSKDSLGNEATGSSNFPRVSPDGRFVAFQTGSRLLKEDTNGGKTDVYVVLNPQSPGATCKGLRPTLVGTPGADLLVGTNGPDVIIGLEGNDKIEGLFGNDVICAGRGNDVVKGGPGADVLLGNQDDDRLVGNWGDDTLLGGRGNDDLRGG